MKLSQALESSGLVRSDAEILLAALLTRDRAFLLTHPEHILTKAQQPKWATMVERRNSGEPISYIIGSKEFYGRTFLVDRRVHIPRPSTENLVSMALDFLEHPKNKVRDLETGIIGVAKMLRECSSINTLVDIGTGSGCIAITLALERPDLHIIAIDVSTDALDVAKENAARLGASGIEFMKGDLLSPMEGYEEPFIVVSNPPYIPLSTVLEKEVNNFEPQISLRGGQRGEALVQKISAHASNMTCCHGYVLECLMQQLPLLTGSAP